MVFDPDEFQASVDRIDAASFGVMIARVIQAKPSSQNWGLVNEAIAEWCGWNAEHEMVEALVKRIAAGDPR